MIRALLLRSGVADLPVRQVYSARGRRWLATVVLPPEAAMTLQRLVRVLETLHAEATAAETVVRARAETVAIARALDTLVGIGPVLG